MHRVGIIPFDMRDDMVALLFVTSHTRGRWVFPKGRQEPLETHVETCHREAFEEAGVRGIVLEDFPVTSAITKSTSGDMVKVPVTYYPMLVTEQVDDWPEKDKRKRHWTLLEQAPRVTYREDFLRLIKRFNELLPWIREAAMHHRQEPQEARTQAR